MPDSSEQVLDAGYASFYTDLEQLIRERREELVMLQFSDRRHGNIDPRAVSLRAIALVKADLQKVQGGIA